MTEIAEKLPNIVSPSCHDQLRDEFTDYQLMQETEVPREEEVDVFWGKVGQMRRLSGNQRFPVLSKLAKGVLCIPHSNASSERAFSILKKVKTDFRSELGHDTLCAIFALKFNEDKCCFQSDFSERVLKAAKKSHLQLQQRSQELMYDPPFHFHSSIYFL